MHPVLKLNGDFLIIRLIKVSAQIMHSTTLVYGLLLLIGTFNRIIRKWISSGICGSGCIFYQIVNAHSSNCLEELNITLKSNTMLLFLSGKIWFICWQTELRI